MKKILWIDVETTGLDVSLHSVIQIAGIIDIDGKAVEEFNLYVKPHPESEILDSALQINGITREQLETFPEMEDTHKALLRIWGKYINKFNKADKFNIAGQRVTFDYQAIREFFTRLDDPYLGSYIDQWHGRIDLLDITKGLAGLGIIKSPDVKLSTLCKEFGVEIKAHDAMSDIRATRELYYIFKNNLIWKDNGDQQG